jgi:hypothetical protein
MAIFLSDLMTNRAVVPHSNEVGQPIQFSGAVRIPAGTDLVNTDRILLARVPTGAVFNHFFCRVPDLDGATALTLDFGYQRPATDPGKAYDATDNPYITGAIATADDDFFEEDSTVGQAGGVINLAASGFTVTSSPALAGWVDVCITPAVSATTAPTADSQIEFTIEIYLDEYGTMGEFSGNSSIKYETNIQL